MDKKYKICIITTVSSSIKSFFLDQIKCLSKNGFEVTIVCSNDDELKREVKGYANYIPISMDRGIDAIGGIKALVEMRRIFVEKQFDIVQYSTPNAAFYASIASKLAGTKIRLYHNMGYRYVVSKGIKRVILKMLEKITCALSTEIQPVSFSNLEFGVKEKLFTRDKARVIWNGSTGGVDLSKFDISKKEEWKNEVFSKYQITQGSFVFGFVGRITRDKGINELLGAYERLSLENSNTKLMIVGNEENVEYLDKELYMRAKSRKDIIFTGVTQQVYKYFSAFDVLILPSYREGFGNVVIEAQAMGVPVIVSDIPGPTDAIEKNITGMVVEKKNVECLYRAMSHLKNNPIRCCEMKQQAYEYAKNRFDSKQLMAYILDDKKRLVADI